MPELYLPIIKELAFLVAEIALLKRQFDCLAELAVADEWLPTRTR